MSDKPTATTPVSKTRIMRRRKRPRSGTMTLPLPPESSKQGRKTNVATKSLADMTANTKPTFLRHVLFDNLLKSDKCDRLLYQSWPATTDIWCYNCCHPFATTPIPRPMAEATHGRYPVYGVYCSGSCAMRHILTQSTNKTNELQWLMTMLRTVFDMSHTVVAAPPPEMLKVFGGTLSVDEYRVKATSTNMIVHMPPFVTHNMIIETVPLSVKTKPSTHKMAVGSLELAGDSGLGKPLRIPPETTPDMSAYVEFLNNKQQS